MERRGEETILLKRITDGGLEVESPGAGGYGRFFENFCNFWKNIYFNAILITFCTLLEPFERTKFERESLVGTGQ